MLIAVSANAAFANFLQCKMSCFESEFLDDFNLGEDVIKDVYSFAGVSTRIQRYFSVVTRVNVFGTSDSNLSFRNMVCSGFSDFFKTPIVEVDLINGLLKAVFQSSDNFSFCWVGGKQGLIDNPELGVLMQGLPPFRRLCLHWDCGRRFIF